MLSAEGRSGGDEFSVPAVEQPWAGVWGNAGGAVMGLLCGRGGTINEGSWNDRLTGL